MRPISVGILFFVSIITGFALAILFVLKKEPKICTGACDLKGENCTCPNCTSCDPETLTCKKISNIDNEIIKPAIIIKPTIVPEIQNIEIVEPVTKSPTVPDPQIQNIEIVKPAIRSPTVSQIQNIEIVEPVTKSPTVPDPQIQNIKIVKPAIRSPTVSQIQIIEIVEPTKSPTLTQIQNIKLAPPTTSITSNFTSAPTTSITSNFTTAPTTSITSNFTTAPTTSITSNFTTAPTTSTFGLLDINPAPVGSKETFYLQQTNPDINKNSLCIYNPQLATNTRSKANKLEVEAMCNADPNCVGYYSSTSGDSFVATRTLPNNCKDFKPSNKAWTVFYQKQNNKYIDTSSIQRNNSKNRQSYGCDYSPNLYTSTGDKAVIEETCKLDANCVGYYESDSVPKLFLATKTLPENCTELSPNNANAIKFSKFNKKIT